jgi:hypothetical protein
MLKRILRYVVDRSQKPDSPSLTEYAIATEAIGRPSSFDPQQDPIVRVSMKSIRQRLESYFETEGRSESLRLAISKGRYRACFTAGEEKGIYPVLKRFWHPYFDSRRPNVLVHSEPLFLRDARDPRGVRIRDVHLNNPETAPELIKKLWPELKGWPLVPDYAYLSVGTVYCMLAASFTLYSTGWVLLMLLAFYWIVEVKGYRKWTFPLAVAGANSIFLYTMEQTLRGWLNRAVDVFTFRFQWTGDFAPVARSCTVLLVMWYLCYWLHRRKIFFKL